MPQPPRPETTCARTPEGRPSATRPLVPPLHLSLVYCMAGLDQVDAVYRKEDAGYVYARDGHPNADQLAAKVAALEGAEAALVCASGMAAESAVLLSLLDGGGHVALSEGVYGRTATLIARELARFGVGHALFDATRPATLRAALTPATRVVVVETLSNPLLRLAAVEALAEVALAADARLVVDHNF